MRMARGTVAHVEQRIDGLLLQAEEDRRLARPKDETERRLLNRRVAEGAILRPFPGMYAKPQDWDSLSRNDRALRIIRTIALSHPSWVFCMESACFVHGLEAASSSGGIVHVAVTREANLKNSRHVIRHPYEELPGVDVIDDVRVIKLERSVIDCLARFDLPRGLAVADSYLRRYHISRESLLQLALKAPLDRDDRVNACATAAWSNPLSENGGESFARGRMIQLGFEAPELQVPMRDPVDHSRMFRVDFLWRLPDGQLVIGELDGKDKYVRREMTGGLTPIDVMSRERLRESRLSMTGAKVVRFSFDQVLEGVPLRHLLTSAGVPRRQGGEGLPTALISALSFATSD
jgi:hypothetical protein